MNRHFRIFSFGVVVCACALSWSLSGQGQWSSSSAITTSPVPGAVLQNSTAPSPIVADLEPVNMVVQPSDHIRVRGFNGSVVYHANPNLHALTVRVHKTRSPIDNDDWQLSIHREGSAVIVEIDGPTSKELWNDVEQKPAQSIPSYNLVLDGPSLPLDINWRKGRVQVSQLNADLNVTNLNGETDVIGDQGDVTITSQTGTIDLNQVNGHVHVDTYNSRVLVNNVKGKLTLENFIGSSELASVQGDVAVTTYRGPTHLSGIKGSLAFASDNGPMHIDRFQGVLRGQSAQGPVFAEIEGKANVYMQSKTGDVHLKLPQSGAWVNVGTNEGQIWVPSFLKVTRLPSELLRTGRLRGINGGTVFVRTTSGNIRVQ